MWVRAPNIYHSLFLVQICVQAYVKSTMGAFNSTRHQMTLLLPRVLLFMLKAAKQLTTYKLTLPYIHHSLILLCVSTIGNKTQDAYNYTTHQMITLLPGMYLSEVQSELWLMSCRPEQPPTYRGVFTNICLQYTFRGGGTQKLSTWFNACCFSPIPGQLNVAGSNSVLELKKKSNRS